MTSRRLLAFLGLAVVTVLAALKLRMETGFAMWDPTRGSIDLRYYFDWTHAWASGADVYLRPERPEYPPASLPVLYLIAGWLDWNSARLLMGTCSLLGIGLLVAVALRGTGADSWRQRWAAALLVLSMNGTGVSLGNGQLSNLVLPLVLGALYLLRRAPGGVWHDLAGAAMLTAALVKPSLTVPFLWLALVFPAAVRIRPLALTGAAYAALTVLALRVSGTPLLGSLRAAVENGLSIAPTALDPNVHFLLSRLHLEPLMLPATAMLWLLLGWWVWRHRGLDVWLLLAVTALVARGWTYHRVYEDVLLILPEIALWRIAAGDREAGRGGFGAFSLLVANALVVLAPGTFTGPFPWAYERGLLLAQGLVWTGTLAFLLRQAAREERT